MNASTVHRYINTWLDVGMLEQDLVTRRYRHQLELEPRSDD